MASELKNLSNYNKKEIPSAEDMKIAIIVSDWNTEITGALAQGAVETLKKHKINEDDILLSKVPGTFELTFASKYIIENQDVDAVIAIGCVIKGETPHFDYICQGVTQGITKINLEYDVPVIFGVLTTENLEQARDRAGGKHGNKGIEAAITAIKMADFKAEFYNEDFLFDDDDMFEDDMEGDYDEDDLDLDQPFWVN